ncbi:glycosyltransferase [Paramagnetospirillum kuznetsovii]|uniref:Glycosyltransferase n=1 Tax=Paramagnetospirillum kuznetsovii TaxID=2053833 RepID=A0A364P2S0_9PROT|nr:glycosyltransferase family 2 protein [Paramagnetospirillum kuznetsovii]RAU23586.1 glycosyltransferase [Paramagnetospirillum kuznetsovii]
MKTITIFTPAYNEELNISHCVQAIRDLFAGPLAGYDYEHIFADNNSSDRTVEILAQVAHDDKRIKVILNARNYGTFRSCFNALKSAKGDAVVVLFPADLQDPPEVIVTFVRKWEEGFDVVYGVRQQREENAVMAWVRRMYYRVVSLLSHIDIPQNVGEFQLIDRKVLEYLKQFNDYYPYIRGMIASCGFKSAAVPYNWVARKRGVTKNSLIRLVDQGLNGMISFSTAPVRLCMLVGLLLSFASMGYALISLIISLVHFREEAAPGIQTLIVGMFFFAGVQLFFLGVIGEYVGAIHSQVRQRPLVTERGRINFEPPEAS